MSQWRHVYPERSRSWPPTFMASKLSHPITWLHCLRFARCSVVYTSTSTALSGKCLECSAWFYFVIDPHCQGLNYCSSKSRCFSAKCRPTFRRSPARGIQSQHTTVDVNGDFQPLYTRKYITNGKATVTIIINRKSHVHVGSRLVATMRWGSSNIVEKLMEY